MPIAYCLLPRCGCLAIQVKESTINFTSMPIDGKRPSKQLRKTFGMVLINSASGGRQYAICNRIINRLINSWLKQIKLDS